MRHRKHRQSLGVTKEHRAAMMAALCSGLFLHGQIKTTLTKAKALRPFAEKIITLAKLARDAKKERAVHLRRLAMSKVRNRQAVQELFTKRVEQFAERKGGYTRILKIGNRVGDAAEVAIVRLIDANDEGYEKNSDKKAPTSVTSMSAPESETTAGT